MPSRATTRLYRPSFDLLEGRDVPSAVFHEAPVLRAGGEVHHFGGHGHGRHHAGATHPGEAHVITRVLQKKKNPLRGPVGPQGPAGPTGPVGPQGPSGTVISYNLAAGADSAPIAVAADKPIFIVANNTTSGDRGTGFISLEHPAGAFLEWSGLNSTSAAAATPTATGGFSSTAGTVMLTFDFGGNVTLRVADANHFVIHNGATSAQTGSVWILTAPV